MTTLRFKRRLPSYKICATSTPVDVYVRGLVNELYPEALSSIDHYSRGLYSEELHTKALMKYNIPQTTEHQLKVFLSNDTYIQRSIDIVHSELRDAFTVTAISMSQLDNVSYVPTSSAGYGYVGNKRDNYIEARSRATANIANYRRRGTDLLLTPFKAFARTQLALRTDPKIRHVWGAPFHTILIEGTVAQPIIEKLSRSDTPIFIGKDMFKTLPSTLFRMMNANQYVYCLDLKSFDASVNSFFIDSFFDFLSTTVTFPNVFSSYSLSYIRYDLLNTPIVMPNGKLYICTTGIPSGSYFTQLIDSYVNLIILRASQLQIYSETLPTYVLGDDSMFVHQDPTRLNDFAVALAAYGFTLNLKKSIVSKSPSEIVFLGHNFYGSRLTRGDFTLACLAIHTEDPITDVSLSIIRLYSLLYDSGYNSFFIMNLITRAHLRYTVPVSHPYPYAPLFLLS